MLLQEGNATVITTSNDYIANINNKLNASCERMLIEDKVICFTPSHTKLFYHNAEPPKPSPRRLFQAIQGFLKTKYKS
jgi:hypothetical protein